MHFKLPEGTTCTMQCKHQRKSERHKETVNQQH